MKNHPDLIALLRSRRSIRRFEPRPVPDEMLVRVVEAGQWAPSPWNLQMRAFVVVKDPAVIARLRAAAYDQSALAGAPAVIVACLMPPSTVYTDQDAFFAPADTYLAAQNVLLAAHALGLGAVCMGGFREAEVKAICGIPEEVRALLLIPLGYPAEQPEPRERPPLGRIAFLDRWEQRWPAAASLMPVPGDYGVHGGADILRAPLGAGGKAEKRDACRPQGVLRGGAVGAPPPTMPGGG